MIDFFGHLGYAALVLGMWLVVQRRAAGWAVRSAGSATWVVLGIIMDMSSIWFWSAVFLAMDVFGFLRWRKKHDPIRANNSSV